jgi:hypothetical protein
VSGPDDTVRATVAVLRPDDEVHVRAGWSLDGRRTRTAGDAEAPTSEWHVLPSADRPRVLVPVAPAQARRALLRQEDGAGGLSRRVLTAALSSRVGRLAPTIRVSARGHGPALERRLAQVLDVPSVGVAIRLGTVRANRKPLLQVMAEDGRTVAWAKVVPDADAARVLDPEVHALTRYAGRLAGVEVPRVVADITWAAHRVLVLSPLPGGEQPWRWWPVPVDAMRAVAAADGPVTRETLGSMPSWSAWQADRDRLRAVPAVEEWVARLDRLATAALNLFGGDVVGMGSWHGDWTPWNMAVRGSLALAQGEPVSRDGSVVELWDWENARTHVPVGWDAMHYVVQRPLSVRQGPAPVQREALLAPAQGALSSLGVSPTQRSAVWVTYLLEIGHRYLRGLARVGTPALERRLNWTLAALDVAMADTSPVGRPASRVSSLAGEAEETS